MHSYVSPRGLLYYFLLPVSTACLLAPLFMLLSSEESLKSNMNKGERTSCSPWPWQFPHPICRFTFHFPFPPNSHISSQISPLWKMLCVVAVSWFSCIANTNVKIVWVFCILILVNILWWQDTASSDTHLISYCCCSIKEDQREFAMIYGNTFTNKFTFRTFGYPSQHFFQVTCFLHQKHGVSSAKPPIPPSHTRTLIHAIVCMVWLLLLPYIASLSPFLFGLVFPAICVFFLDV